MVHGLRMATPPTPPPRTPVVAVVGTSAACTARFLARLVRGDAAVDNELKPPAPGEVVRWRLDTKYYVADVVCVFHLVPGGYFDEKVVVSDKSIASEIAHNAEAIVLCYDPTTDGAFHAVARLAEDVRLASKSGEMRLLASTSGDTSGTGDGSGDDERDGSPEVRLLVGLFGDTNRESLTEETFEKSRNRGDTWASSRGYESVAAGADVKIDEAVIGASKKFGDDGRDDGTRRVREALEAHVWPGLRMKAKGDGGTVLGRGEVVASEKEESVKSEDDNQKDLADDSDEVDALEKMLQTMARVRLASVGVSDDERRRAAAEAATRMMKMFDMEGDDEEEE